MIKEMKMAQMCVRKLPAPKQLFVVRAALSAGRAKTWVEHDGSRDLGEL